MKTDKNHSLQINQLLERIEYQQERINWLMNYNNNEIKQMKKHFDFWQKTALENLEYRIKCNNSTLNTLSNKHSLSSIHLKVSK